MPNVEPSAEPEIDREAIKEARREQDKLRELKTIVRSNYTGARRQTVARQRAHGRARAERRKATAPVPLSPAQIKRRKKAAGIQAAVRSMASGTMPVSADELRKLRNKRRGRTT